MKVFIALCVLFYCVTGTLACNGFKLKIKGIENCGGQQQVVTIDTNYTAKFTSQCEVITSGCVRSTGFQNALVNYNIAKNGMKVAAGNVELCSELDKNNKEAMSQLEMVGFPTQCPVEQGIRCTNFDQKFDISKYKGFLSLARGKPGITLDAKITHDTGKSCFKINIEIYK